MNHSPAEWVFMIGATAYCLAMIGYSLMIVYRRWKSGDPTLRDLSRFGR